MSSYPLARALVLLLCAQLASQRFLVHTYSDVDGLPTSLVRAVEQSADGRMWFGTRVGVVGYDGARWVEHSVLEARPQGFLSLDERGGVWTSTAFTPFRVARFDGRTWEESGEAPSLFRTLPTAFLAIDATLAFLGTDGQGVAVYEEGRWWRLPIAGEVNYRVNGLARSGDDLLIAVREVLWRVSLRTPRQAPQVVEGLPPGEIQGLAGDRRGVFVASAQWVGRLDEGGFERIKTRRSFVIARQGAFLRIEPDAGGGAYIGSADSLWHVHRNGRVDALDRKTGLPFVGAAGVKLDREGNVWIVSSLGIAKIVPTEVVTYDRVAGLLDDEVTAVCRREDGTLVCGHGGGLTLFRRDITRTIDFEGSPILQRVIDLEPDRAGGMWIAAAWKGLGRLGADDNVEFFELPGRAEQVHAVAADVDGVWVGCGDGLWRFEDGEFVRPHCEGHVADLAIRRLDLDPDGTLWVSTGKDGVWCRSADGSVRHWTSEDGVRRSAYDTELHSDGRRLVASRAGLLELAEDRLVPAVGIDVTDPVYAIERDPLSDRIWLGTSNGVVEIKGRELRWIRTEQGLASRETNRDALMPTADGNLWVGTTGGLSLLKEGSERPRVRPTVDLVEVRHGGEALPVVDGQWTTPPESSDLAWQWRAISFFDERRLRFRYMIEGLHGDWHGPQHLAAHELHMAPLPPGEYRLRVIAVAADGLESEEFVSRTLYVPTPLASRWWFLALAGLSALGLVWIVFAHFAQRRYAHRLELEVRRRTEQLAASECALAADREQLSLMLGSIADGVVATDRDGNVILWNRAAEELTATAVGQALGRPLQTLLHSARGIPRQGSFKLGEIEVEGRSRWFEASSAPLGGDDGAAAVVAFRDITERLQIERDHAHRQRLESLGLLAGGIAHDFNNYLAVVGGTLAMLDEECSLDPEQRELVHSASATLRRAVSLTQQLLTFSHGGAPVRKPVALSGLIHDAVEFALSGAAVKASVEIESGLPLAEIDEGQVAQVLHNLLINARQAMSDGGSVTVRATRARELPEGLENRGWLAIELEDDGPGMSAEVLAHIFDPFFTKREGGTGLGLSVVHSVIGRHGGRVIARSVPGEGARFTIFLPVTVAEAPVIMSTPAANTTSQLSVLVMDDEPALRSLFVSMLRRLGHRCVTAAEGASAVRLYEQAMRGLAPFDVVLLDLTVPGGLGGKDAAQQLLAMDPDARLVAVSGYSRDMELGDHAKSGFCAALAKPFRMAELAGTLAAVASRTAGNSAT